MSPTRRFLAAMFALSLIASVSHAGVTTTLRTTPSKDNTRKAVLAKLPAWARAYAKGPMEPLDVASFNSALEDSVRSSTWPRLAAVVALRFITAMSIEDEGGIQLSVHRISEGARECVATVLCDGLPDDSVTAEYRVLRLTRDDRGVWHVAEALGAWRCQGGRGPQTLGVVPCN